MILSFNPERVDSTFVKLIQAPFEFFTIEETIEEKETHLAYGERPAHQDVLIIKNDNVDIDTILEYSKDKENSNSIQLMKLSKCCDGIFLRIGKTGEAYIDVFELKDTISDSTWYGKKRNKNGTMKGSAKEQLEAGVLIALTIANIIGISKIRAINCTIAYSFEGNDIAHSSPITKKTRVGMAVKPWKKKRADLLEGETKYGQCLDINLRAIKLNKESNQQIYSEHISFDF